MKVPSFFLTFRVNYSSGSEYIFDLSFQFSNIDAPYDGLPQMAHRGVSGGAQPGMQPLKRERVDPSYGDVESE